MLSAVWRSLPIYLLALVLSSCLSSEKHLSESLSATGGIIAVRPVTEMPQHFALGVDGSAGVQILRVPDKMVWTAHVTRPRVELREGPSSEFQVQDAVLTRGELVIEFQRVGVWQKIVAPLSGYKGWVHFQTLGKRTANIERLDIKAQLMPRVFSVRPIKTAFDFPALHPLNVDIPQGAMFVLLKESAGRRLVWLAETNAVVWFDQDFVD